MTIEANTEIQQENRLQPPCETRPEEQDGTDPQETQGPPEAYLEALEALSSQFEIVVPIIQNLDADEKEGPDPLSTLTFTVARYAMQQIRNAAPLDHVCLVLHTAGGVYLAAEMIADQLRNHPGETTVFVPYIATSGGTLVALAADNLVLGPTARLGPIGSVTCGYESSSYAKLRNDKSAKRIEDQTLLISYDAAKFDDYAKRNARKFLSPSHQGVGDRQYCVTDALAGDQHSHGRGFDKKDLTEIGVQFMGREEYLPAAFQLVDEHVHALTIPNRH